MNLKINILGVGYEIIETNEEHDSMLTKCDGYCDKSSKKIVVATRSKDCELDDWDSMKRKNLRHEIIHAFLFESGLAENFYHPKEFGHDETMVDWFAIQFPKLIAAFKEAGCLED